MFPKHVTRRASTCFFISLFGLLIADLPAQGIAETAAPPLSPPASSTRALADAGHALQFDGVDDRARILDNPILSGGPGKSLTLEAWVKLSTISGNHPVVTKFLDKNQKDWGLLIQDGAPIAVIENSGDNWEYKAGAVPQNAWTHVALTFDNGANVVRIYVNGAEAGSGATLSKDMPDTGAKILFGGHAYNTDCMLGILDDVRVWNYARSAAQLQIDMNRVLQGNEIGLIGYWRFDEASGQLSADLTASRNAVRLGLTDASEASDPAWVISDAPLFREAFVQVNSPNGGEQWSVGSSHEILWNASDAITEVKIELSVDDGVSYSTVVAATPNDGAYGWVVPDVASSGCRIRIADAGDDDPADESNASFAIILPQSVERFAVFELVLHVAKTYDNPYQQLSVQATFVGPAGSKTVPGFWDGGSVWIIRFSPDAVGSWRYSTASSDPGLVSSGDFNCVPSNRRGGIQAMPSSPLHLQYEDGTPFWWFGETNWAAFRRDASENYDSSAFREYIRVRAAQGFNYLHGNLLAGGNEGGEPFVGGTGNKVNPAFWQEVDERVRFMNAQGITVGLMLSWKSDKLGSGSSNPVMAYDWTDFPSQESRLLYCKYVAARYAAFNTAFIISGEYNEAPTKQPNTVAAWAQLANAIKNNDPQNRLRAIHGQGRVEIFADDTWMSFGDYMQFYDAVHEATLSARDHAKPVVNAEYAYFLRDQDSDGIVDKPNSATIQQFRHASWDIVMAGGYLVSGFGTTYLGGKRDPGPFDVFASKNDPAEEQLPHIKTFFTAVDWWNFTPSDNRITGAGTKYCLIDPAGNYLAYARGTTTALQLQLTENVVNKYSLQRFDPRRGTWTKLPDQISGTTLSLSPPDNQDWAFLVQKVIGPPTLTLTAPNGGESWCVGSTHNLTWTSTGLVENVKLEFSKNAGTNWSPIVSSTANSGAFSWLVPDSVSNNCLVRVSDAVDGDPTDQSNAVFAIVALPPPPTIDSFTPVSGPAGTQVTIAGTNLSTANVVEFNNTAAASFIVQSDNLILATVPPGASTGKIRVTTVAGAALSPADFMVTSSIVTLTFQPQHDAHVKFSTPNSNFGTSSTLRLRTSSSEKINSYLKFQVSGVSGAVLSAKLRLYVTEPGRKGGSVYSVSNNYNGSPTAWTQSGLNWNNAPAIPGAALSSAGAVSLNTWVELDVTSAITGNGNFSFAIANGSSDIVYYGSKEGLNKPELIVRVNQAASEPLANQTFIDETTVRPQEFSLQQNYPNPFNPATTIRFELPIASIVTVRIYDIRGAEIITLLDRIEKNAGLHSLAWDGRAHSGATVPSGIYFYSLRAQPKSADARAFHQIRKMTFLK